MGNKLILILIIIISLVVINSGCNEKIISREESIDENAIKFTPEMDLFQPVIHIKEWEDPIPMPGPVNTAGGEDACFITEDGNTFLFFFTPNVSVPANEQLIDGVTGIWWCQKQGDSWTEPTRIILSNNLALDGAPFYQDNKLWFASFRNGNYRDDGDIWIAIYDNGEWIYIKNAGQLLNEEYNIGELHIINNGKTMFFHRESRPNSGEYDIFITNFENETWTEPVNIGPPISTIKDDSRPFVTQDGKELWFTRESSKGYTGPAVYRSVKDIEGNWSEPQEIVSNFAGEPTLDGEGNLYFVHHFFDEEGKMIEADIYVCYKSYYFFSLLKLTNLQ